MKKKIRRPRKYIGHLYEAEIYKTYKNSYGIIIGDDDEQLVFRTDLHKFAKWIGRVSEWVKQNEALSRKK